MNRDLNISVIITTYNRAEILRQTLESMTHLDQAGVSVQYVIVDNNSQDDSRHVIESFSRILPIRYLLEPTLGQNAARNTALANAALGRIVAFTDDDITPSPDWLQAIVDTCERYPDIHVFGGAIGVEWPCDNCPRWAFHPLISGICFAHHEYAPSERLYEHGRAFPCSGNMWLRASILQGGRRFNTAHGPQARQVLAGSETSLLSELAREGYRMLYTPKARVVHRVQPHMLATDYVLKKAAIAGRSRPYINGELSRPALFRQNAWLWRFLRSGSLVRWLLLYALGTIVPAPNWRVKVLFASLRGLAYERELLLVSFARSRMRLSSA